MEIGSRLCNFACERLLLFVCRYEICTQIRGK
nr:MAG TPA: hypothetical protein [Bacteriophage sp.]